MSMQSLVRNARLAVRAEVLAAEIKLRVYMRKAVLLLLALAVGLIAVVLVNIAVYQYLVLQWGPVATPLALAAVDVVLAALALICAMTAKAGPELEIAESLRRTSAAAVEDDLKGFSSGQGLFGLVSGSSAEHRSLSLILPLISTFLAVLRKKKSTR
ncbi:MAG: hypothetical protein LCH46_09655 [Proteobacteria bacterium]|nr:hypothetical protein [Pseudomonadota bacterium]